MRNPTLYWHDNEETETKDAFFSEAEKRVQPNILQEVNLPIVSGEDCTREYEGILNIDAEKDLCAGFKAGGKDTCLGLLKLRYYGTKQNRS